MFNSSQFNRFYSLALAMSAVAFGTIHGLQTTSVSIYYDGAAHVQITALIMIIIYELVQSIVFFAVGIVSAYLPSRLIAAFVMKQTRPRVMFCIIIGAMLSALFLPLCASVPYFLLSFFPDEPGYLDRCADYALPMTIAGAIGGYVFWRCTRGASGNGALAPDQFS